MIGNGASEHNGHDSHLTGIKMVENILKKSGEFASKNALQKALPKSMPTQTFNRILSHLEKSNKILFTKNRTVIWLYPTNLKLDKLWAESTLLR